MEIAAHLNCSHDTIERRFASQIKDGHKVRNGRLRSKQFEIAMEGNPTMLVWLGKQLLGQRDRVEQVETVSVADAIAQAEQVLQKRNGHSNGNGKQHSDLPVAE